LGIILSQEFEIDLARTLFFIEQHSSKAKEKFRVGLFKELSSINVFPRKYRKSIYFNDLDVRDLIYDGYVIPFKILSNNNYLVFGLIKHRAVFSLKQ